MTPKSLSTALTGLAAGLLLVAGAGISTFGSAFGPRPTAPLAELAWFHASAQSFVILAAFAVAILCLGRHRALGGAWVFWTGASLLASGILGVFHILVWPGLLGDGSILGRLSNTASWFYLLVYSSIVLIFPALSFRQPERSSFRLSAAVYAGGACASLALGGLTVLFERALPLLVVNGVFTPFSLLWTGTLTVATGSGAAAAYRRYVRERDAMLVFLALFLAVLSIGLLLGLLAGRRYDFWWYSGRLVIVTAYVTLLIGFLQEGYALFGKQKDLADERQRLLAAEQTARALVEGEQRRLQAILDRIPEGVVILEAPDGRLSLANRSAAAWRDRHPGVAAPRFGVPVDTFRTVGYRHPDGRAYAHEELPSVRALRGETVLGAELAYDRAGTRTVMLVNAAPIGDDAGTVTAAVVVFQDITERKQAEEMAGFLARASVLLAGSLDAETILNQLAHLAVPALADWCAIHMVQGDGTVRRVAAAFADPGRAERLRELERRYPHDALSPPSLVAEVIRSGRSAVAPELTDAMLAAGAQDASHAQLRQALSFRCAVVVPLVVRDRVAGALTVAAAGAGRQYVPAEAAVLEDLARRAALAIDNARLYREVQEQMEVHVTLNTALREAVVGRDRALAELEQTLHTRDLFLWSLSHDLKNPLTTLKGIAQIQRRRLERAGALDADQYMQGLDIIEKATASMIGILDELLTAARVQAGQPLVLDVRPTDLVALVREAVAEHQPSTSRHHLRLATELPDLVGRWDPARLDRVVRNLLANALRYSPAGGDIMLTVSHQTEAGRDWAVLEVQDHGLGIPAADVPHIFEPFYRASNVAGQSSGTGIGLASVQQIVAQHGGTVDVQSEPGTGPVFTVRLPLDGSGPAAS